MSETIISIQNLSKAYPIYAKPTDMIREVLTGRPHHDVFWALKDINFSVHEKQRIGIIGPNGAGKSTLLKIITGNLPPTSGSIKINGKISAMLSLVSSLNPDETGLSNIRFNLLLNGCPSSAINRLTEEIVDFIELGAFIYRPVKTYSSGMNARLAFAIATAIEPEILVIDEVLGAGDGYFIGKATKRMIDLCDRGKALIFVSHSISSVQMLCDSVIWMDNGSIRKIGSVDYVTKLYEEDYRQREDEITREGNAARKKAQLSNTHLTDMADSNLYRIRIVAKGKDQRFVDTHYIKDIKINGEEISLSIVDLDRDEKMAGLDLIGSEWGRMYDKDGFESRVISSQSGRRRGGQILLKKPSGLNPASLWSVQLEFETTSILGSEQLEIELLDYSSGNWLRESAIEYNKLNNNWTRVSVNLNIPIVSEGGFIRTLEKIKQDNLPDVEILNVGVFLDQQLSHIIKERQPFLINVEIIANRKVAIADVGIKIMRSDGMYVFWQSSGMNGENLTNVEGKIKVSFVFDENYFSAGEYSISAYCANGWEIEKNYPYSEVFDRKVSAFPFSVRAEIPALDFGQINMRVPVFYVKH